MLKKFMTVLMAVVCVFSLCLFGCGDDVPEVFAGDYEKMDNQKIESLLTDISEKQGKKTDIDFSKGIDFSMKMKVESSGATLEAVNGKIEYSLKTKVVDNDFVIAGKMITDVGDKDADMDMEIYYADGFAFCKYGEDKVKMSARFDDILGEFNLDDISQIGNQGDGFDFESILKQVQDLNASGKISLESDKLGLDVKKAQASIDASGDQTKLKVELEFTMEMDMFGAKSKNETDAVYYYLFDKDYNLVGMYVDGTTKTEGTFDGKTGKMEVKMNISAVPFDGEIEAPSDLNTYQLEN